MVNTPLIPCFVFGASGYAGVELARIIQGHPAFKLAGLFVSAASSDANKSLSSLYPKYAGLIDLPLLPATEDNLTTLKADLSSQPKALVFLATPHEFSHDIAPTLASDTTTVLDLSGGFRLQNPALYPEYYGFEHQHAEQLPNIPYGLPEWLDTSLEGHNLISLPGCYPTASQLALKPLIKNSLLDSAFKPVINAVSGVSGAGRKANLATSFCELSLRPYNLFAHRHLPEINQQLGTDVIFTPHVANYDRGILATITVQVANGTTLNDINSAFEQAYQDQPLVRLKDTIPQISDVAYTPFADIYWQLDGQHLIIISAIDNVLKGASSQAIQCANLVVQLPQQTGLVNVVEGS